MSDPASPAAGTPKARLFVALELPEPVVSALVAWRAPLLRELPALRPLAREALHVTLCFIGWRAQAAIAPIAALVEAGTRASGGVTGLALGAPLWLPRRAPRVLALALEDRHGQLASLQAQVVGALADGGWHEREARAYLPHVTIARVRTGESPPCRTELPPAPALAFDGAAVVLYRSHLERAGARYEPLSVSRLA